MSILEQINDIIENKKKNQNGDVIAAYCHRNSKEFGNGYSFRVNDNERVYFKTIQEMLDWLNKKGWKINTLHKS